MHQENIPSRKTLFEQAADLPTTEQVNYLKRVCGDDEELIAYVLALCESDQESEQQTIWKQGAWLAVQATANRSTNMIGEIVGKYEIIGYLGGGMSEVYEAERRDHDTVRRAVIKFPKTQFDDHERRRFIREMQALNQLDDHPNIAQLNDYGTWEKDGRPYLILKYIEGQSLRDLLNKEGHLPVARVIELTQQISAGLSAAHQLKLLHRDLKPENIMLTREDVVKLIDFGIAKPLAGAALTADLLTDSIIGTPEYMSPEQIRGEPLDITSDVYSLGVVLFELLTGQRPFAGTEYVVIHKHLHETPPSLRQLQASLPAAVDSVVRKALAKDPQQRQQSIQQLAEELQRANVTTQPDIPPVQVAAAPRRWFLRAAIAGAGVLALALGIGVALQQNSPTKIAGYLTPTPTTEPYATPTQAATPAAGSPTPTPTATPSATPSQSDKTPALPSFAEDLGNGVKLEMVAIPGGTFLMGSPDGEGDEDEHPQHSVTLSLCYFGKFEVTQAQWDAVMGSKSNPSHFKYKGDNLPVNTVKWGDAFDFCRGLSEKTGKTYRLPTEAEWEYACRAGTTSKYSFGDDQSLLDQYAWHGWNSGDKFHPVGQKKPNAWGLFDMHGNAKEWCQDRYRKDYYKQSPRKGPQGPPSGDNADWGVQRGGSYMQFPSGPAPDKYRCAKRDGSSTGPLNNSITSGFRVALVAKTQ